ncbi:MAG TPA: GNAT family N-acetyltransferase [Flavobacteriaceae bacterium]|nr:GNAT family N-acetyltransferase [Flavobacteriaceae bacterium]
MKYPIKHEENEGRGTFYMSDDNGIVSELTYELRNGTMAVDHTETRDNLKGQGLASQVLDFVVNYARENRLKIRPICPFVKTKFNEIPSYNDVRA